MTDIKDTPIDAQIVQKLMTRKSDSNLFAIKRISSTLNIYKRLKEWKCHSPGIEDADEKRK